MDIKLIYLCFLYGLFLESRGQFFISECPTGWLTHNKNCYKFVYDEFLVFEESDAACGKFGSTLLAVDDANEHKFITDWLKSNNIMSRTNWFTSGRYVNRVLYWESQGSIYTGPTYWAEQPPLNWNSNNEREHIVYAYGNVDFPYYGWKLASASTLCNYICEVPKSESLNLQIQQRDFEYGADMTNPLNVKRGPVIVDQPQTILVVAGSLPAEIQCSASGNDYPTFTWWLGNDYTSNATELTSSVDNRYTLSGGQLTIDTPSEQDIGSYHCKADNQIGSVLSSKAKLVYGYLAYFSNIDPEPVWATTFKGTKMDCNAPAHSPDVTYEWFKNQATNIFVWPSNGNMFVSRAGFLYVSEVQPTDAKKRYFCVVTLIPTEGMKMARAFMPSRTNLGLLLLLNSESATDNDYGPILNTHAFPTPALVGRTIYLECVAYGSHPLSYSWRREDGRPFVKGTKISAKNRVLSIANAPLSAEGNYICTCTRSTGASDSKIISVQMETAPYFPEPIKDVFADPGMRISLYCKAVARPAATYFWYKDGALLETIPGVMEVKRHSLTILKVDKSRDEGMYQCGATNQHGTTFRSSQLKVLYFKPNFNRRPLSPVTLAALGGNLTIPCGVEAAPVPQVRWLKNGQDLGVYVGETSGRVGMNSQYGLTIQGVQYSDAGNYLCVASNDLGEATNATQVRVMEGILFSNPPAQTDVVVNRTAFMFCEAAYNRASYDLSYVWRFNGRVIDFTISPEYILGNQNNLQGLYITNAQYKHRGTYECEARTTLHSVAQAAFLDVFGPPGPPAGCYADDETITTRSVRIVWTVTSDMWRGGPIMQYDIEAETNFNPGVWTLVAVDVFEPLTVNEARDNGKREDQRAFTIQDLIPNTSYRFRVRAINMYGRGKLASRPTNSVKIFQTAPIIPPRNVGGGGGKVGTLTIRWEPLEPSEHCGPNLGYHVYWKRNGDEKDWKREVANGEKAHVEGFKTVTVGPDNYYLEYRVKVGAYNDNGNGPNSTEKVIFSAEGMPNSVPILKDCETYNSTSIFVHWEPVPDTREYMKGRVAGYRIYYYNQKYGETPNDEPDPTIHTIKVKDVYGQKSKVKLIGLKYNTGYYARVQVFNTAGAGPKGEWRWGETGIKALTDYPTHVAVHPDTEHSVRVTWRGVGTHPGEDSLLGYIMRVWKVQEDVRTAADTKTDKVQEAILGSLQSHVVYELRVIGYSRAGEGSKSNAVFFTVKGGNIPFDPSTSRFCYYDANVDTCGGASFTISYFLLLLSLAYVLCRQL